MAFEASASKARPHTAAPLSRAATTAHRLVR
jgi:hypothetical protein